MLPREHHAVRPASTRPTSKISRIAALTFLVTQVAIGCGTLATGSRDFRIHHGEASLPWPDLSAAAVDQLHGEHDVAVVVGIERYADVPGVPGAIDNVNDWYDYLARSRGVPLTRIHLLRDNQATLEKIRDRVEKAAAQAEPGGTFWFIFVGHGVPAPNQREGLLVGYDAQQDPDSLFTRSLAQSDLFRLLNSGRQERAVVVLDACFSGRASMGGGVLSPGLQPLLPVAGPATTLPGIVLMSAAASDQFAGPLPGAERPAFSYLMLGALRGWADRYPGLGNADGLVTAREASAYVRDVLRVLVEGRSQEPSLTTEQPDVVLAREADEAGPDLVEMKIRMASSASPRVAGASDRTTEERKSARRITPGAMLSPLERPPRLQVIELRGLSAAEDAVFSPSGRYVYFLGDRPGSDNEAVYRVEVGSTRVEEVMPTGGRAYWGFAPDGTVVSLGPDIDVAAVLRVRPHADELKRLRIFDKTVHSFHFGLPPGRDGYLTARTLRSEYESLPADEDFLCAAVDAVTGKAVTEFPCGFTDGALAYFSEHDTFVAWDASEQVDGDEGYFREPLNFASPGSFEPVGVPKRFYDYSDWTVGGIDRELGRSFLVAAEDDDHDKERYSWREDLPDDTRRDGESILMIDAAERRVSEFRSEFGLYDVLCYDEDLKRLWFVQQSDDDGDRLLYYGDGQGIDPGWRQTSRVVSCGVNREMCRDEVIADLPSRLLAIKGRGSRYQFDWRAFEPEHREIYVCEDHPAHPRVWQIPMEKGASTPITTPSSCRRGTPRPGGGVIVAGDDLSAPVTFLSRDGRNVTLDPGGDSQLRLSYFDASPDGRAIAYVAVPETRAGSKSRPPQLRVVTW